MPKRTNEAGRVRILDVAVTAIRDRLKMTQQEFADSFGIPVQTLRHWEQGLRRPDEAARAYLLVISRMPDKVLQALEKEKASPPEASYQSISSYLKELRAEITRRRNSNRDRREKTHWVHTGINRLEQSKLLDWIEAQLDRVPTL